MSCSWIADLFTRVIAGTYAPERYRATDEERKEMYAANVHETADTSVADYVWLPISFDGERVEIRWRNMWNLKDYE